MGYFSNLSAREDYDREEVNKEVLNENMIKIIMQVFPDKDKHQLFLMDEKNLIGLYGRARQIIKKQNKTLSSINTEEQEQIDEFSIPDEQESKGRR